MVFKPTEIDPQLLQIFTLDLKELKLIKAIISTNNGISNKSSKRLLIKPIKKLKPKIGTIIKKIVA